VVPASVGKHDSSVLQSSLLRQLACAPKGVVHSPSPASVTPTQAVLAGQRCSLVHACPTAVSTAGKQVAVTALHNKPV
jgi:hypothetical protein